MSEHMFHRSEDAKRQGYASCSFMHASTTVRARSQKTKPPLQPKLPALEHNDAARHTFAQQQATRSRHGTSERASGRPTTTQNRVRLARGEGGAKQEEGSGDSIGSRGQ